MEQESKRELNWTGERYVPKIRGTIALEHLHRYAFASEYVQGKVVLDIASGEGYGSEMLSRTAKRVYGVDIDEASVKHAQQNYKAENLEYYLGSCTVIPLSNASVDIVVSFETIEHINDHAKMMQEVKRVLRPGGTLLISSPEKSVYDEINHKPNPFHLKELSQTDFRELLGRHFKHTAFLGQRVLHGSALVGADGKASVARTYDFSSLPKKIVSERGLSNPVYIVAICSDKPLKDTSGSLCEQNIWENEFCVEQLQKVRLLTDEKESLAKIKSEKEGVIVSLNEQIGSLEGQIQRLTAQVAEKNGVIAEKDQIIIDLENQLLGKKEAFAGLSSDFEGLRESINYKTQQIKGLHCDISQKDNEIGVLSEAVCNRDREIAGLKAQILERDGAISQKDHDMDNLRAYLDLVKSSWSWRLTAPLRAVQEKAISIIQTIKRYRMAALIIWTHRKTGIFDPQWYLLSYPDVKASGMNPWWHFAMYGVYEHRTPHGLFTEKNYIWLNPDVSESGAMHYVIHGWREGRNIQVLFDKDFYLEKNKDVKRAGVDPVIHYLKYGSKEGRRPHRYVNQKFYINSYKDIKESGIEPLSHYLHWGWKEGRRIIPLFDTVFYLNHNHDIRDCGIEPFSHYVLVGGLEGRDPNAFFNTEKALQIDAEIKVKKENPLFYYTDGKWESDPSPSTTLYLSMAEN